MSDKTKVKSTRMVHKDQDSWIDDRVEEWPVDKSFIVRRALSYYMARGHTKDKVLRGGKTEPEDKNKIKRTYMIFKYQDRWVDKKSDSWDVDKSFILRRAIYYYMARGYKRDKKLKARLVEAGIKLGDA